MNAIENETKEQIEIFKRLVGERVAKKDFHDFKTFMLSNMRESANIAKSSKDQSAKLQTTWENMDEFFVKKEKFAEDFKKHEDAIEQLKQQIREHYYSEDESQHNESIEDVDGELNDASTKHDEEAKSHKSIGELRPVPELLLENEDVKSRRSGGQPKNNTLNMNAERDQLVQQQGITKVVTVMQDSQGISTIQESVEENKAANDKDDGRSVRKSAIDGKSQRSFAKSIKSRRLGPQTQAMLDNLTDKVAIVEDQLEGMRGVFDGWKEDNTPGWNLIC